MAAEFPKPITPLLIEVERSFSGRLIKVTIADSRLVAKVQQVRDWTGSGHECTDIVLGNQQPPRERVLRPDRGRGLISSPSLLI